VKTRRRKGGGREGDVSKRMAEVTERISLERKMRFRVNFRMKKKKEKKNSFLLSCQKEKRDDHIQKAVKVGQKGYCVLENTFRFRGGAGPMHSSLL